MLVCWLQTFEQIALKNRNGHLGTSLYATQFLPQLMHMLHMSAPFVNHAAEIIPCWVQIFEHMLFGGALCQAY